MEKLRSKGKRAHIIDDAYDFAVCMGIWLTGCVLLFLKNCMTLKAAVLLCC